jgi:glucokinase
MEPWVVGVDLGGTTIKLGLIDPQKKILERRRIPTNPEEGPKNAIEHIAEVVNEYRKFVPKREKIAALGICCPGPMDHEAGMLINPTNLPRFYNVPFRQMLFDSLNMPVSLEHDAKAAALGEFYYGAGRTQKSMVYVVVGTGVGAAIIMDGQLIRGVKNFAGEIGHTTVDRNGELCSCGSKGCLETYTSGPWLARRYQHLLEKENRTNHLTQEIPITGETVIRQAREGDPLARKIMLQAGEALGIAVATMAMILDIELFVFGGGVSKCGDLLLEPARNTLWKYSFRTVSPRVRLMLSELGEDSPLLGCGWQACQLLKNIQD